MLSSLTAPRTALLLVLAASVGVLGGAYVFQYAFGYQPCELCLYQRIPWWIVIGVGCGAYWAQNRLPGLGNMLLVLIGLTLLAGAGLAGYHAGVEWKWWQGPTACSGAPVDFNNLEDLTAAILAAPVVRCDDVAWSLFGISMAGYNFLISAALGLFAILVPLRGRS